jgi:hypothetical protein
MAQGHISLSQLLLCTLRGSTLPRKRPGRLERRLGRCPQPESCCATLLAPTASPGAMKQWRDDIDILLGMAHSVSTGPRPRSSRCQHEASASVRSPSVRATPTEDLRAALNHRRAGEDALVSLERSNDLRVELNHRRAGEDARVSLERACERRQNVEGRNLDYDFAVVAPQAPTGARIQAGVPLAGVGCAGGSSPCSNLAIQVPAAPAGKVQRDDKSVGILAGLRHRHYGSRWRHRRNGDILPCCLVWAGPDLAHEPCPRIDLLLERALRAVHSELRQRLPTTWRGGSPPRSEAGARETLRAFISRFTKVRGTIPRISDASIITAFR